MKKKVSEESKVLDQRGRRAKEGSELKLTSTETSRVSVVSRIETPSSSLLLGGEDLSISGEDSNDGRKVGKAGETRVGVVAKGSDDRGREEGESGEDGEGVDGRGHVLQV